jgi:hypothetical protein
MRCIIARSEPVASPVRLPQGISIEPGDRAPDSVDLVLTMPNQQKLVRRLKQPGPGECDAPRSDPEAPKMAIRLGHDKNASSAESVPASATPASDPPRTIM